MSRPKLSYDSAGTPGVWAENLADLYRGMGFVHGKHRPLQSLVLSTAGRGRLAASLLPRAELEGIDTLVHRLEIPRRGEAAASELSQRGASLLDSYIAGLRAGLVVAGRLLPLKVLGANIEFPDRASIISGTLIASYLGLAQCQERMERALVDALREAADPSLLEAMFAPNLDGWDPELLRSVETGATSSAAMVSATLGGGSNAWAIDGRRTSRGTPILCGDPHLGINQLPALFLEFRARLPDDYWLGATIPGLPGLGVGRNRNVAWSGTFGVADNVDWTVEEIEDGLASRGAGASVAVRERAVKLGRRLLGQKNLLFSQTDRGVLEGQGRRRLASRWSGGEKAHEAVEAYMIAPAAKSADEFLDSLDGAHPFSLHFVVADKSGTISYREGGRIPKRTKGWSGLYPIAATAGGWTGCYEGAGLPRASSDDGLVVSANEVRHADDGTPLATLAQPPYRYDRIEELLRARDDHDLETMKEIQRDLTSLQARRLLPHLLDLEPPHELREFLLKWDLRYDVDSRGAHGFELLRNAAIDVLADDLGGDWLRHMLQNSELPTWWSSGFDRLLSTPATWTRERRVKVKARIHGLRPNTLTRWGDLRRTKLPHLVLGGLPTWLGYDRGPFEVPGSVATVNQGNFTVVDGVQSVVAPAYRFITDLDDDFALSALPGGVDGSRFSASYTQWLSEYWDSKYHRIAPPSDGESREDIPL